MKSTWRRASLTIKEQNEKENPEGKKAVAENWTKAVSFITGKIQQDPFLLKDCDPTQFITLGAADIVVASFPKSGSVRVSQIVANLIEHALRRHSPDDWTGEECDPNVPRVVPRFEKTSDEQAEGIVGTRLFSSNIRYDFLANHAKESKVIYVVRDPRHAALELYNSSFIKHMSFKDFVDVFIGEPDDTNPYNYKTHFLQFLENARELDILFLKFEDIELNPARALNDMIKHLGIELDLTPTEMRDIIARTGATEGHYLTSWGSVARSIRTDNFASFFERDIQNRFDKELKVDWKLVKTGTV